MIFYVILLVGTGEPLPYCNKNTLGKIGSKFGIGRPPPPSVGTKDQIFRQIQFEGSPKYQRFGCMFRVVICVLKDEEQIGHLVLPCWQSMVFREATQWREAQVGGKVANSTSRYKPAIINLWSPWPPSFVKPDTHLERKFPYRKNCNAMLPVMKRGSFPGWRLSQNIPKRMILRLMGEDADDIGWESWWRRTPDVCQLEGICLRDQIRNNLPTCRPATWPQLPNISHMMSPKNCTIKNLID